MLDLVVYGLAAAVVVFATVRGVRRHEYGWLLRFYALVLLAFGGSALMRTAPFAWLDVVFIGVVACLIGMCLVDRRYRRAA
jgi:hypothetical protein